MATIIKIKRTTGAVAPSGLEQGELAYVYDTSAASTCAGGNGLRLFIGDPSSTSKILPPKTDALQSLLKYSHHTYLPYSRQETNPHNEKNKANNVEQKPLPPFQHVKPRP